MEVMADGSGEKDVDSVELGGVWTLGCVEKCGVCEPSYGLEEAEWHLKKSRRNRKREICVVEETGGNKMEMKFQVCDVKKPLASVWERR